MDEHDHDHDQDHDHDLKSQQSHAPSGFMQDTPPRADVDEILRRKRKAREYKVSVSAPVSGYEGRGWGLDGMQIDVVEERCLIFAKLGYMTRRIETSSLRTATTPRTRH
jgi:hypothetical protein